MLISRLSPPVNGGAAAADKPAAAEKSAGGRPGSTQSRGWAELDDDSLLELVCGGQVEAFEPLMRRYNQRMFRVARGIVQNDSEAEDVVQQSYLSALLHLEQFSGRARFTTWLTRIVINEALARVRRQRRDAGTESEMLPLAWTLGVSTTHTPEDEVSRTELRRLIEKSVDALPEAQRIVFILRDVEGMSGSEAAECLSLSEENVRVRLHRARVTLRQALFDQAGEVLGETFAFAGERCDRIVSGVFEQLRLK